MTEGNAMGGVFVLTKVVCCVGLFDCGIWKWYVLFFDGGCSIVC